MSATRQLSTCTILILAIFSSSTRAGYLPDSKSFHSFWTVVHSINQLKTIYAIFNLSTRLISAIISYPNGKETQPPTAGASGDKPSGDPTPPPDPARVSFTGSGSAQSIKVVDDSPEPEEKSRNEEPSEKHYFMPPEDLDHMLEQLTAELKKRDRLVFLSFDIDGTIYHRPARLDSVDQEDIFADEQLESLSTIGKWLENQAGHTEPGIDIQHCQGFFRCPVLGRPAIRGWYSTPSYYDLSRRGFHHYSNDPALRFEPVEQLSLPAG